MESFKEQAKSLIEKLLSDDPSLINQPVKEAIERITPTPSQAVSYTKTMAEADKEYEIPFPIGCKKFSIRLRSTSYSWRFSYSPGKVAASEEPYSTVPAAGEYYEDYPLMIAHGQSLYVACSTAAQTLECIFWV